MVVHESNRAANNGKTDTPGPTRPDWVPTLTTFRKPDRRKAILQLTNTLLPYIGLWYLMIRSIQLGYSYTLTLIIALPAAGFLVRIFILFHGCVHGSLFPARRVNTFFDYLLGVLVFTPFACIKGWRKTLPSGERP